MPHTASTRCIQVNGKDEPLAAPTLAALLHDKAIDSGRRGIAAAVNGTVIPRTAWSQTPLRPGDRIEIVGARQGG